MGKFELTDQYIIDSNGTKLFRIRALADFANVREGDLGGFVESKRNLSRFDNAWIDGDAQVKGNALVDDNAWIGGNARVSGNAWIGGNACVSDNACIEGNAMVKGNAWIGGNAVIRNNLVIAGNAYISSDKDYTMVVGFGSKQRNTTFYRTIDDDIGVACGCFSGTLEQFRKKVVETHGNSKYAKEYLAIADLMKFHFER